MESVTLVHVHVKTSSRADFIKATHENRKHSVLEPGNLRFDFLQSPENPDCFLLYEVYEHEAAAKAHKGTQHYLNWRDTVADMMEKPRIGQPMLALGIR